MPIVFKLEERLAGFLGTSAKKNEKVSVIFRELLGPSDEHLASRLDQLHLCLFGKIPGLPDPPRIGDLVITIDRDLNGKAFVDELQLTGRMIAAGPIEAGQLVTIKDIKAIDSVDLGFKVDPSVAVVVVRSFYWKRSLFYDFGPLHPEAGDRKYDVEKALAQQMTLLVGLPASPPDITSGQSRLHEMKEALDQLDDLLLAQCDDESAYQELLSHAPWMLGTSYSALIRHKKFDDGNIPDFTMVRAYDDCHDIVELKQPFLRLFRSDGTFTAAFSDAWHQAERYLDFSHRQRVYLLDQKQLRFENPRCVLLIGYNLAAPESAAIRAKESFNRLITVMSYDQLFRHARHVFDVVAASEDRTYPGRNKIS